MTDNPFESPKTGTAKRGVKSRDREDLFRIAKYQKGVIVSIVCHLVLIVLRFPLPESFALILGVVGLVVLVVGLVFVCLLVLRVYSPGVGILMAILSLFPCIGLIALLSINEKATQVLSKNRIKVGFFGANLAQFKEQPRQEG